MPRNPEERPTPRELTIEGDTGVGVRLDLLVAGRLGISRNQSATLIANKLVTVNGKSERASYGAAPGDRGAVDVPAPPARDIEGERIPLTVVFEDDDIVVVDKEAGMVVHPA